MKGAKLGPPPLVLRLAAVLAVPLLLYALYATGAKALENHRLNQQAEQLRAEIRGLRQSNIALQRELESARTDEAIERIAREQLGLVRDGEHAIVLLPPKGQPRPLAPVHLSAPVPETPEAPPWRRWWAHFFGVER